MKTKVGFWKVFAISAAYLGFSFIVLYGIGAIGLFVISGFENTKMIDAIVDADASIWGILAISITAPALLTALASRLP